MVVVVVVVVVVVCVRGRPGIGNREVGPGAPVPDSAGGDDHNDDIHGPEVEDSDTCTSLGGGPGPVAASTPIDCQWPGAMLVVAGERASAHKGPTALAEAETTEGEGGGGLGGGAAGLRCSI